MFKKLPNPGNDTNLFQAITRLNYDPNFKVFREFLLAKGRAHVRKRLEDEERDIEIYKLQGALQALSDIEKLSEMGEEVYQTLVQ